MTNSPEFLKGAQAGIEAAAATICDEIANKRRDQRETGQDIPRPLWTELQLRQIANSIHAIDPKTVGGESE